MITVTLNFPEKHCYALSVVFDRTCVTSPQIMKPVQGKGTYKFVFDIVRRKYFHFTEKNMMWVTVNVDVLYEMNIYKREATALIPLKSAKFTKECNDDFFHSNTPCTMIVEVDIPEVKNTIITEEDENYIKGKYIKRRIEDVKDHIGNRFRTLFEAASFPRKMTLYGFGLIDASAFPSTTVIDTFQQIEALVRRLYKYANIEFNPAVDWVEIVRFLAISVFNYTDDPGVSENEFTLPYGATRSADCEDLTAVTIHMFQLYTSLSDDVSVCVKYAKQYDIGFCVLVINKDVDHMCAVAIGKTSNIIIESVSAKINHHGRHELKNIKNKVEIKTSGYRRIRQYTAGGSKNYGNILQYFNMRTGDLVVPVNANGAQGVTYDEFVSKDYKNVILKCTKDYEMWAKYDSKLLPLPEFVRPYTEYVSRAKSTLNISDAPISEIVNGYGWVNTETLEQKLIQDKIKEIKWSIHKLNIAPYNLFFVFF